MSRGEPVVSGLPAVVRAIALLIIAAVVLLAAAITAGGAWLDLDSHDLVELAKWLGIAAAISLSIALVFLLAVDRAADGRYITRLSITGILAALVFLGVIGISLVQLDTLGDDHSVRRLVFAVATGITALFAMLAAWLDSGPIRATARAATDIARGNYRARLPETGNTEIAQLATAINLLAARAQSAAISQSNQNRARESLLLAIASDAQTPIDNLRAITTSLSASQPPNPSLLRRYVEALDRETAALQRRIDEVEEIARLESGQITLRLQPVSLAQLIISVCDRLQPGAATRNVIISPRVDFSAPRALVDPEQTARALDALLAYSLSETPDAAQLAVQMREAGPFVQIAAVEIPEGDEPDLVARVRWESAHRHRESALSLAVASHLIELQGGTVLISHTPPGTPMVVVSLPRS